MKIECEIPFELHQQFFAIEGRFNSREQWVSSVRPRGLLRSVCVRVTMADGNEVHLDSDAHTDLLCNCSTTAADAQAECDRRNNKEAASGGE